jgi:hypothetical protein
MALILDLRSEPRKLDAALAPVAMVSAASLSSGRESMTADRRRQTSDSSASQVFTTQGSH